MSVDQGGATQAATVLTAVPIAPAVRVLDGDGKPIAGLHVVFHATLGGGVVAPEDPVVTDEDGVAAVVSWTLGGVAGPQELTAAIADATVDLRVVFSANATPADPASLDVGPTNRAHVEGDVFTIGALLRDASGNIVTSPLEPSFVSSNPTVATVGAVSGAVNVLAPGTTVISVTRAGLGAEVLVTVSSPPTTFVGTTTVLDGSPNGLAISSTGVAYVTHTMLRAVTRFDLPSESPTDVVAGTSYALDVTFLPDGSQAWVEGIVVDVATNTAIDTVALPGTTLRVLASADGQFVYATNTDGVITRVDATTHATISLTTNGNPINGIALHPTRPVLLATSMNGDLHEVDIATFTLNRTLAVGGVGQGLVVSPDGLRVFVAREGAPLDVRDGTTLDRLTTAATGGDAFDVAIMPSGRYLVVSRFDNVAVLDASSFVAYQNFPVDQPRRIAIDPTGTVVMVARTGHGVLFLK